MGHAVLESYSRVLESLANTVMSRIEDVLYADAITQDPSLAVSRRETPIDSSSFSRSGNLSSPRDEAEKSTPAETPNSMTLSDFMGWNMEGGREM